MTDHMSSVRCLGCGYAVHSVVPDGACPECGARVDTARGRALEQAGRGLRRMREGLRLVAAGLIGLAVNFILSVPAAFVSWSPSSTFAPILFRGYMLLVTATRMRGYTAVAAGVWWATSLLPPQYRAVRSIARIAAIGWLLNGLSPIPQFWAQSRSESPLRWRIAHIVGSLVAAAILVAIARLGHAGSVLAEGEPSSQTRVPFRAAYYAIGVVAIAGWFLPEFSPTDGVTDTRWMMLTGIEGAMTAVAWFLLARPLWKVAQVCDRADWRRLALEEAR